MSATNDFESDSDSSGGQITPTTSRSPSTIPLDWGPNSLVNSRLQDAVDEGHFISATLSDALKGLNIAADQQSQLYAILSIADELRNFESPAEFTVGFIGDSGVGKSSLINALLDETDLAQTACLGRACTNVVTEFRHSRVSDNAPYVAEIQCLSSSEIEELLRTLVRDFRQYNLRNDDQYDADELLELEKRSRLAWDTLKEAFGHLADCTKEFLKQGDRSYDSDLEDRIVGWKDQLVWPDNFNINGTRITASSAAECTDKVSQFSDGKLWPFIKVIRLFLKTAVLENGLVLVDLPGFNDINTARVKVAETRLYQCDEVFVLADISRVTTDRAVESFMNRQLGNNFEGLKRSQGVTIVCTKSDLFRDSELERDLRKIPEFDPTPLSHIAEEKEEAENNDKSTYYLDVQRSNILMSGRNRHLEKKLLDYYKSHASRREMRAFCISNAYYTESRKSLKSLPQRNSIIIRDKRLAFEKKIQSSGIPELRNFCQSIPLRSQTEEVKHFLCTRVKGLIEKTDLWLAVTASGLLDNHAVRESIESTQSDLSNKLHNSVENVRLRLDLAKLELLQLPLTRYLRHWERDALSEVDQWAGWHVATISAFCRHEGAYATAAQPVMRDWNLELLKSMTTTMEPTEDSYRRVYDREIDTLQTQTNQELQNLLLHISDLEGIDVFTQTFPRRQRDLNHSILVVTENFYYALEAIYHDLLRSHQSSYVMQHMKPMYLQNSSDGGRNVKARCLQRIRDRVSADPKLFPRLRELFITAMNQLLRRTSNTLKAAVERCCEEIREDMSLLRGDESVTAGDQAVLDGVRRILEDMKQRFEQAEGEFGIEET